MTDEVVPPNILPASETAQRGPIGLRVIGAMKLGSGLLLTAAGFGIFRMLDRDLGASVEHFVTRLHLDPENRLIHPLLEKVAGIDRAHLRAIGAGTFFYALLHIVEGTGLLLMKHWAEYLTVFATGSLLPLEVYEIIRRPDLIRCSVFLINIAVFAYVVVKLRQQHVQKKAARGAG